MKTNLWITVHVKVKHEHHFPGDCSVCPKEWNCGPPEGPRRGSLGAAQRRCEPGGAEEGPKGAGHQGRGPFKVPRREHHLLPAAQRTLCDWRAAGEGIGVAAMSSRLQWCCCLPGFIRIFATARATLESRVGRSSLTLTVAGERTGAGHSQGRTPQRWTAQPPMLHAGWRSLWCRPDCAGGSWCR